MGLKSPDYIGGYEINKIIAPTFQSGRLVNSLN